MEVKVDADELYELRKEASRADRYHADLVEISSRHNKLIATLGGNDPGSCETWFIARSEHKEFVVRTHKQICRLNDVITELRKENDKQQCTIDGLRLKIANATWELQ